VRTSPSGAKHDQSASNHVQVCSWPKCEVPTGPENV
jgi:hypothetical protein